MSLSPVNNTEQLLEFTPEACLKYAKSLPNPKNISPKTFDPIGWLKAMWIKAANGFNSERISKAIEVLYKNNEFSAADLHWYSRRTIVRCEEFLPESWIDDAVHNAHLDSTKAAIVAPRVKKLVELELQKKKEPPKPPVIIIPPVIPAIIEGGVCGGAVPDSPVVDPIHDRQPQEIRRNSGVWKKQKLEAEQMKTPADRHNNHIATGKPQPFLLKDKLDPTNEKAVEKFRKVINLRFPYIENVKAFAKRLEEKSVDEAVKFFECFFLTPQLYILEVIDERYVDAFIKEMRASYIVLGDKKKDDREKDLPNMTPYEIRYQFYAYVEMHQNDPNEVIAARYKKLLKALTPPAKQRRASQSA